MIRRTLIGFASGLVLWPLVGNAQSKAITRAIVLSVAPDPSSRMREFRDQLAELGYIEGRNITLGFRSAEGHLARLPALAEALVREEVDVILAESTAAARAAHNATRTIPIVAIVGIDPVDSGLAKSLAHPGGNITGVTTFANETNAKRVELVHELAPDAVRLAMIMAAFPSAEALVQETGSKLGLTVDVVVTDPDHLGETLNPSILSRYDALLLVPDVVLRSKMEQILKLVTQTRKPAVFPERAWAERGGLLSYGPDIRDVSRHWATQLVRVLEGQKAGDVPFQRPTKFDLSINLLAARAIGFHIPPNLLARADEVIE
jgi:ABC-type uncharacterized transport system substrate-binding protein